MPTKNHKDFCPTKQTMIVALFGDFLVIGKYRGLQGNPCNENRDPAMRTGVLCNKNRVFPVGIDLQGVPFKLYRVWVCSVHKYMLFFEKRKPLMPHILLDIFGKVMTIKTFDPNGYYSFCSLQLAQIIAEVAISRDFFQEISFERFLLRDSCQKISFVRFLL